MIPITAFLTDRFTTKRLFLVSMVIFTLGSFLAGWGPSFVVLLLGRLVQAAGAGILMPLVMTVLMWTFPVDKRGTAMGLFGIVIAFARHRPHRGGVIIDRYTWHDMFYIITVAVGRRSAYRRVRAAEGRRNEEGRHARRALRHPVVAGFRRPIVTACPPSAPTACVPTLSPARSLAR